MEVPPEQLALELIAERLADLLNIARVDVRLEADLRAPYADGVVKAGPFTFLVEWKRSGAAAVVAQAIEQVRHHAAHINGDVLPLVAVPFMGQAGRERCAEGNVAWIDLSGNAGISAPGLHILVEGKPNQYKRRGRPSSVFAPKSSRIVRWLLLHPSQTLSQREIARATNTDEGYTSKIVGKLDAAGLIVRDVNGAIRPRDPGLLLDAWREAYEFSKHHLIRGHVPARTGESLLGKLAKVLGKSSAPYAATGLAAAWLLDRFAGFRTVTLYLEQEPSSDMLAALQFREETRGSNVWLVVPNDEGVFLGASIRDGIRCVHPVQVYLDLSGHAERAQEAAQNLRAMHLNWPSDG